MREQRPSPIRGMPVVGLAAAGMLLGHWFGYLLAIPDRATRARVLADSGHGYWLSAVQAAVAIAALTLGYMAVRHLRRREPQPAPDAAFRLRLPMRLAAIQISMFVMIEIVERLAVGAPVAQMFGHHLFFLGILVQVLVAAVAARFLLWFHRAVERIAEWIRRPQARPATRTLPRSVFRFVRPVPVLAGAAGLRSPPSR